MSNHIVCVGNGTALKGKRLGRVIDSFDRVIRFNRCNTIGYEQDVGQKMTDYGHYKEIGLSAPKVKTVWTLTYELEIYKNDQLICEYAHGEALKIVHYPHKVYPTTGLSILCCLIKEFDVVFTAGWFKNPWNFDHFNNTVQASQTSHDMSLDRLVLQHFINRGKVVEID